MLQASSTSVVPSALFCAAKNCTINVQVFNHQGMSTSVNIDTADDMFVDSLLASSKVQLQSVTPSIGLLCCMYSAGFAYCT